MNSSGLSKLEIFTDGGSRGNPGPAAIGVSASKNCLSFFQLSKCIGDTTNNVAEYTAVIEALDYLVKNKVCANQIDFFLDSELVVKQIKGEYKIKQPHLQSLFFKLNKLLEMLSTSEIKFNYIPRTQNKIADSLVNQALNSHSI